MTWRVSFGPWGGGGQGFGVGGLSECWPELLGREGRAGRMPPPCESPHFFSSLPLTLFSPSLCLAVPPPCPPLPLQTKSMPRR